ncbi:Hypothetical protein CpCP13_0923 [Corynebacterium pseudotuberculosis]|nr:Hypothetical protein Cp267_0943 [Corynebacterium pseudotuberculosis 267]AJC13641.1 Hypothetical protein CpVD57_0924 [Corynebacterium pseudotuberculosis]AKC73665.1 Hypothetical protein Cp226_0938 [Corynebacterium pseudotuberculosis]ANQ77094.1 Hypothetical protein CpCP13_0923 [Corynebacterium pseudotuberculosis]AQU92620.1 Hypothetical protein CpMIC6_0970 [Corynebacterium pseudotuberculosis]
MSMRFERSSRLIRKSLRAETINLLKKGSHRLSRRWEFLSIYVAICYFMAVALNIL